MAWQLITVTQTLATKRGDRLRFQRCGRKLEVGEEVWRHHTRKRTRYYCKGCYKKLRIEVIVRYVCIDCGHKWKKLWGRVWTTPKCPNCGSENVVMRGYPP